MTTNIDELYVSCIDVKPRNVDDWSKILWAENEGSDFWQSFDYEWDDRTFTLVANRSSVVGVAIDGTVYEDWESYEDTLEVDEDGDPIVPEYTFSDEGTIDGVAYVTVLDGGGNPQEYNIPLDDAQSRYQWLTEADFDHLMEAEPSMWGAEGPMMNYWYPLGETAGQYSRFNPVTAALKVDGEPLCVVMVDDEYGLALTGGGMDLSWEICSAFIALGYLPPAHFADLPAYASEWSETNELVHRAMRRALTITIERAQYRINQLGNLRSRMSGGKARD